MSDYTISLLMIFIGLQIMGLMWIMLSFDSKLDTERANSMARHPAGKGKVL